MKKDLQKRLKSYSLAAGALVAAGGARGQIIYTDVNPDVTKNINGDFYDLDLNNDAVVDFRIEISKSSFISTFFSYVYRYVEIDPFGSNAAAVSSSTYTRALNKGNDIGAASMVFNSNSQAMAGKFKFVSSTFVFSTQWGKWNGAVDKYVGLKLIVSGQTHYGWARLDVNTITGSFTVKDYAYDSTASKIIKAGLVPADTAKNVAASDIGENSNGSDLRVTFNKANNEATVGQYRVMVVKSASAASFNITTAKAVAAANYTVVTPTGSNISQVLAAGAKDTDGDPVNIGTPYKVFVMTKADGVNATDDVLSLPSAEITLNTTAGVGFNLIAKDKGNKLSSEDFEVSFSKAVNETGVSEYRVIVVKSADAASFNLTMAQAVTAANYTSISPTGSNLQQALAKAANDKDGDSIAQNVPYKYFVMSVANSTKANLDNLSAPSNEVTLANTIGINELSENDVLVYSNGNSVTIDMKQTRFRSGSVSIMDASGRLIVQKQLNNQKTNIDLNVSNGIYVVAIEADGKLLRKKIMLNH